MNFQELVSTYGYAAVVLGTFFEGETILVLAGFAAQRGYLELHWVAAAAFAGTLSGNLLYFCLGRYRGHAVLARRPAWQRKTRRVLELLDAHPAAAIIGFRFLYGIRTVAPFAMGLTRVSAVKFVALDSIGIALWAAAVGGLGYLFGEGLEHLVAGVRRYEIWAFAALAAAGAAAWLVHFVRERAARAGLRGPEG